MKLGALLVLDRALHFLWDRYINLMLPGWEHLQLWQNRVCNAYENHYEKVHPHEAIS